MTPTKEELLTLQIELEEKINKTGKEAGQTSERHRNEAIGIFAGFALLLSILGYFGLQQIVGNQVKAIGAESLTSAAKDSAKQAASYERTAAASTEQINRLLVDAQGNGIIPKGTIIVWAPVDKTSRIPVGWAICDGNMGTPDLRDRFIMGAKDMSEVRSQGGSTKHNHAGRLTGSRFEGSNIGRNGTGTTRHDDNGVLITEASHLPPFVKVLYIMRL